MIITCTCAGCGGNFNTYVQQKTYCSVACECITWKAAYAALQKEYAKLEDRLARVHNISGEGQ